MENQQNKNDILLSMINTEHYPLIMEDDNLPVTTSLSLSDISSLGVSFAPVCQCLETIINSGVNKSAEQMYKFDFRGHSGTMTKLKDNSGFLSTITNSNNGIVGQGAFVPVNSSIPLDTTALIMAVTLASIEKKLDLIKEIQEDILEFLQLKEKAALKGNLEVLTEIMNNYKHNWNNDKYKNNKHILVQDIKKESEQSIIFHRERIKSRLKKGKFLHSDKEVKMKLDKLILEMRDYQLALYLYSFSEFLEVLLLENFDSKYLDSVVNKIEQYSYDYRIIYTDLYEKIKDNANTSIESRVLNGIVGINKVVGKTISKVPVLGDTKLDETFIESSEKVDEFNLKREGNLVYSLKKVQDSVVNPFVNNLLMIDKIHNYSTELMFDSNNLYLVHND